MDKNHRAAEYQRIRQETLAICDNLEVEDCASQPRSYISPPKWHLAHTTWFFEEIILKNWLPKLSYYNNNFSFLFNSYYNSLGVFNAQHKRGYLSRPTLREVIKYRSHIDNIMIELLLKNNLSSSQDFLLKIGLNHEQQHQELLYMDIKFILSSNLINYSNKIYNTHQDYSEESLFSSQGGLIEIGCEKKSDFSYDNENPRHKVFLHPFLLHKKLVNNGEYLDFINSQGYEISNYWLSLGWDFIKRNNIKHPLYWKHENNIWYEYTLFGLQELDMNAPVVHVSYYEADAYASFKKKRLPSEFEMELFLNSQPRSDIPEVILHPHNSAHAHRQVWCWTTSSYGAYPGFLPFKSTLYEYNKKFMCNQYVLRGGAVVTPYSHYRHSYRNFYRPHQRWMFSGIRLAQDQR